MRLALLLSFVLLAGCLAPKVSTTTGLGPNHARMDPADGLYHYDLSKGGMGALHVAWAPGALSHLDVEKGLDGYVNGLGLNASGFNNAPLAILLFEGKHYEAKAPLNGKVWFDVEPGTRVWFLPSPGTLQLRVSGPFVAGFNPGADGLPVATASLVSGERMIQDEEYQEAHFPHRTPGQPNYAASQVYFSKRFTDMGYTVEVDPYGTDALPCLRAPCASAFANIVATKVGSGPHKDEVLFVAGGHYDMVPGTVHAAFDNTGGSVGTLELARAFSNITMDRTLKFALWGGEESGTLGSEFWIKTHPDAVAHVVSYWNLDVIGMSWPAHPQKPSPILIAAGPDLSSSARDGTTADPVSQQLLGLAKTLQHDWLGYPDTVNNTQVFRYEGVESGEFMGGYAGVNDQSDHASFTHAGIPAWFIFNGDTLKEGNPIRIHDPKDTIANMTKVALSGADAKLDDVLTPAEAAQGRILLAKSFEATLWFPFYATVLTDLGVVEVPSAAGRLPALPGTL